jgi:hypothetical protein
VGDLALDEEAEPLGMGHSPGLAGGFDLGEGLRHAAETELVQLLEGWMGKHVGISSW